MTFNRSPIECTCISYECKWSEMSEIITSFEFLKRSLIALLRNIMTCLTLFMKVWINKCFFIDFWRIYRRPNQTRRSVHTPNEPEGPFGPPKIKNTYKNQWKIGISINLPEHWTGSAVSMSLCVQYIWHPRSYLYKPVPESGLGLASPPRLGASPVATIKWIWTNSNEAAFMDLSLGAGSAWLRRLASGGFAWIRVNVKEANWS